MLKVRKLTTRLAMAVLISIMLNVTWLPSFSSAVSVSSQRLGGHKVATDFQAYWDAHGGLRLNGLPITDEANEVSLSDGKSYATQWFERARYERHPENPASQRVLLGLLGSEFAAGRSFDTASKRQSDATQTYFASTKHSLSNTPAPFKNYWQRYGGLAQFGYPLSEQLSEVSTDGKTYDVQYFERQRFEYHPSAANPDYKVQLGLLGSQQYKQQFVPRADVTSGLTSSHDTITIGMIHEPSTLFSPIDGDGTLLSTIELGLVDTDENGVYFPDLAAFVPTLDNGAAQFVGADGPDQYLQVKWVLRRGVKWADGVEVTASDVVYGWQGIYENPNLSVNRFTADKFSSFVAVDNYTVVGKFLSENQAKALYAKDKGRYGQYKNQTGPVIDSLYFADTYIYPEHAYGKLDAARIQDSDYGRAPLGPGPYRVREWITGQAIILEPNPNYNLTPNHPAIKTVIFKIVTETNQLLAQLETGEVDIAAEDANLSQFTALDQLTRQGRVKAVFLPSATWEHIDFNLGNPLFQDKRVRQAFAYAINRQGIVDKVMDGRTVVAHSWITPNITQFYNPDVRKYEYNPDKARQLLAAAGYSPGPDGILTGPGGRMSFKYSTTAGNVYRQTVTQLVAADLKAVGVDAQLDYMLSDLLFATDGPLTRRTFAFAEFAWVGITDPGGEDLYSTSGIPTAQNGYSGNNNPGWSNPENDKLLHDANDVKDIVLDPTKRAVAYKAEQLIFAEELPTLPLHPRLSVTVAPADLKNYRPGGITNALTWNIQDWRW